MPGKINPVLMEAVMQVSIKVMANDGTSSDTVSRRTWQINEFLPLLSHALLESLDLLNRSDDLLADPVLEIICNWDPCPFYRDHSSMIRTALGYWKETSSRFENPDQDH